MYKYTYRGTCMSTIMEQERRSNMCINYYMYKLGNKLGILIRIYKCNLHIRKVCL
jgi:hypothetical protein